MIKVILKQLFKALAIVSLTFVIFFSLYYIYWKLEQKGVFLRKVQELEIGQVYKTEDVYRMLVNEEDVVSFFDESESFRSQKAIDEYSSDQQSTTYPITRLSLGKYKKVGEDYLFIYTDDVSISFEDYESMKRKEYFEIYEVHESNPDPFHIKKIEDGYAIESYKPLYFEKSYKKIPTTVEEFLESYSPTEDVVKERVIR